MPGYKNVIKGLIYCLKELTCWHGGNKAVITKHKRRVICLPDGMGVPNKLATQGDGSTETTS